MARMVEWRVEAFGLRLKGLNYREIGERLSISPVAAQKLVREQIEAQKPTREQVEQIRSVELGRLDYMTNRLMKRIEGDLRDDSAYTILLKIAERRARIVGLDEPKKSFSAIAVVTDLPDPEVERRALRIIQENHGSRALAKKADPVG